MPKKTTTPNPHARKTPRKPKPVRWHDALYIEIYELIKEGHNKKQVAELLGVHYETLNKWIKEKPVLRDIVSRAKKAKTSLAKPENFIEYIYGNLSPQVRDVWDRLEEFDDTENDLRRMELLVNQPVKIRQQLFIHALVCSNFSTNVACQRVGVSKGIYEAWILSDPGFAKLVDEIRWQKKNFIESALMGKIAEGDTNAIIFANKTLNRDRGYETKSENKGEDKKASVTLEDLDLPLEVKRQVLAAHRAAVNGTPKVIEHKPTPKDDGEDE